MDVITVNYMVIFTKKQKQNLLFYRIKVTPWPLNITTEKPLLCVGVDLFTFIIFRLLRYMFALLCVYVKDAKSVLHFCISERRWRMTSRRSYRETAHVALQRRGSWRIFRCLLRSTCDGRRELLLKISISSYVSCKYVQENARELTGFRCNTHSTDDLYTFLVEERILPWRQKF